MISRLSRPRTQRGTITLSVRTFSRPSFFIVSTAHAMARLRLSDPLRRWPKVSVSSASRFHANWSACAASINLSALP